MRKKLFVLCVIVIAVALLLTACAGADLTLTFEVDGEVYATVTTMGKEAIQMPKDPEKEGFVFDGWYWDKDVWEQPFTANSLLETPLAENMIVYAKWKPESETHEHVYGEWEVATPATCTEEGLQKHACTVCGEEETEAIPTVPHTYGKWEIVTPATCTAEGLRKHVCSVCEEEETQAITTIPHTYETKYDETNHWSECSVCGETANAEAHTYVNDVCTVCGKVYGTKGLKFEKIKGGYEVDRIGTAEGTAIEIPSKYEGEPVIAIGSSVFWGCSSLTSIEIPNSVTSIGSYAFYYCSSLTIYAEAAAKPNGWDSSWNKSYCPVVWDYKNNDVADDGYIYTVQNGIRYGIKDGAAVVKRQPSNTEANIASEIIYKDTRYSVTSIGDYAFQYCRGLTSITIPDSVTSIGSYVFYECISLTSIAIPDSVTSIGSSAFYECSSLTGIAIPDSVTSIGGGAFEETGIWNNTEDNSVVYADKWAVGYKGTISDVTLRTDTVGIGSSAFSFCSSLTSIVIPDSVTSIGSSAFSFCSSLTSIVIPDSVTSIGNYAFSGCSSLTIYAEAAAKPSGWESIDCPVVWVYNNNDVADDGYIYTIQNGIRYGIKDGSAVVVRQPSNIIQANIATKIVYGNKTYSVTSIGSYAFYEFSSLTSIAIPDSVTSIGDWAFRDCSSLTSIEIGNSVTSIGSQAFFECSSLTSIAIPNSVTSIGSDAFSWCSSLTSITIPFVGATKEGTSDTHFGYIFGASSSSYNDDYVPNSLKEVIITGGTSIGEYAFYNCRSLTSIAIPNSVTSIGDEAFSWCSSLTSIAIPNGVTSIGSQAFKGCSSLTRIAIPDSVTSIGTYAFSGCSSLTSIEIPNSVTSIGSYAFYYCDSLTSIAIPDSVTSIGYFVFYQCSSLTSIVIPDSVTSIGERAFAQCSSLQSITIPNGVTSIGSSAFYGCSSLETITVAEGNTKYKSAGNCIIETATKTLIAGCKTSVIPTDGSVTSIGSYAFQACSSLTSITIPNGVTSIGYGAFQSCSGLQTIVIPNSVTSIDSYAFQHCSSLQSIEYQGTEAEWKAITKGSDWNYKTGDYTVTCTDGTLTKAQS